MFKRILVAGAAAAALSACQPATSPSDNEAGSTAAGGEASVTNVELNSQDQKFSYAVGVDIARSLEQVKDRIDVDAMTAAMRDVLGGADVRLTTEDMNAAKTAVSNQLQAAEREAADAAKAQAIAKGTKFMEDNAAREGVQTTDSGLQYEVLEQGDGPKPEATDRVKVHYEGTLTDGTVFDSSYERGDPTSFPLNGVIKGWTEGLQLMPVGSTYRFVIPSDLAYGERGAGGRIGPNETLVFKVELLEILE